MEDHKYYACEVRVAHADFKLGRFVIRTPLWLVIAFLDGKELERRIALTKFTALRRHAPDMMLVLQTAVVHTEAEAILRHHAGE
jgi:hypothetical protein